MYYTTTHTAQNFEENESVYETQEGFNLPTLIMESCRVFGVPQWKIYLRNRTEKVKFCRWAIWHFARKYGNMNFRLCGLITTPNEYDHSSVLHALKNLPHDMEQFAWLKEAVKEIEKIF